MLLRCLALWRNENLAGGFAGRFLVVVLVVWLVSHDDLPEIFGPDESCTQLLFTAYAIVRTVPSANRPNQRKKKCWGLRSLIDQQGLSPRHSPWCR